MNLEVIILAGGYATRLRPLSEYIPKPLLPIAGVPLINYIISKVIELNPERIIISTNKKFENNFRYWLKTLESFDPRLLNKIELIIEESTKNEEKLGAIGGLYYAIKEAAIEKDLLVIAGDNLFDFNLRKLIRKMKEKESITIGIYDVKDLELAKNYGVVELDNDKIIKFIEKPEKPATSLISTGIYAIPFEKIQLIEEYIRTPGSEKDNLGKLIEWLIDIRSEKVYGLVYNGIWFDIGNVESYIKANSFIEKMGWNRRWLWP